VAKKKAGKKTAKKTSKRSAAKPPAAKPPAAKQMTSKQTVVEAAAKVVVFFELSGVSGVRFHGEYADIERARLAARSLVLSPDVAQAWIMDNLDIIRKPTV
jgi:hypothetical protein